MHAIKPLCIRIAVDKIGRSSIAKTTVNLKRLNVTRQAKTR